MIKFNCVGFDSNEKTAPILSASAPAAEASSAPAEAPANPEGKRVLIVDDDPVFLMATAMKLRAAGCRVRTARESAAAIAALSEEPADAVLMDINFPPDVCNGGMGSWDGLQLTAWLRRTPGAKGARFIIVSNSELAASRRHAQAVGAVACFQKPVDHGQLIAAVNAEN